MKITKITKLQPGIYAHVCPLCNEVHASASEPDMMPEFSICDCDRNGNKQPVYEVFELDGKMMIRRNTYPRFVGEVMMGPLSDIENVTMLDDCTDPIKLASVMRKAAEFLAKSRKR